jgi:hypothetical protein
MPERELLWNFMELWQYSDTQSGGTSCREDRSAYRLDRLYLSPKYLTEI